MKNFLVSAAFLLCVELAAPQGKWATEYGGTGNQLMPLCTAAVRRADGPKADFTKQEVYDIGYCEGFVAGVADFIQEDAVLTGIPRDQLVRVVQKYMSDHPEQLDKGSSWLVHQALMKAFPKNRK